MLVAINTPSVIPSEENCIENWLSSKEPNTRHDYSRWFKRFVKWNNKETVTPQRVNEYKNDLVASGLKTNTINTYLAPVRDFFRWCCEVGYSDTNPARYLRAVKHKDTNDINRARNLSDIELRKLFMTTSKDSLRDRTDRLYLLLLFNLGLRVSESLGLKLSDIHLDADAPWVDVLGKGSKRRKLGVNVTLLREIEEYLEEFDCLEYDDYLIQSTWWQNGQLNKKPASTEYGRKILKKYCLKANIEGVTTHSGRVTAINILLDSGVAARDVANFAGHSSVSTTRIYDRSDDVRVIQVSNIIDIGGKK